jgi:hypothetical protein
MDNLRCISDNLAQTDDPRGEPLEQPVGRRGLLRFGAGAALIGAAAAIFESSPAGAATRPGLHAATNASRAIDARQDGSGDAIYSHIENAGNPSRAVFGRTVGTGIAIVGSIANEHSNATAAKGTTVGSGPGIEGSSRLGVGGKFAGATAQVQLVPSLASGHPGWGAAGQLFVDNASRLWFCRGGADWQQLA